MSDPVVLLSTGDVVGPAGGVTDDSMVLFSGTSGKLIKGNNAQVTAAGLALLDDVDAAAQMVTLGLTATATELNYTDGVTSAIQTQLNGKAPLTGAGASGTWGISVTGNAATATKLTTARTINGVSFDGTANITVADPTKVPLAGGNLTGDLIYQNVSGGGWARGLAAKIQSTAAFAAGIGFYGNGDSVTTAYIGLGPNFWSSGYGVRVTAAGVTISGATTFDTLITGSVNGNAATATTLTGLTPTVAELNYVDGVTSSIQTQLNDKAPLNSPAFTGTPTAPTPSIGTRSTAIATMQNFANEFGSSLAANGYQKLPSGLIIQWGKATSQPNASTNLTYPIAFPNDVLFAVAQVDESCVADISVRCIPVSGARQTTFRLDNSSSSTSGPAYWLAIGY